MSLYKRCAPYGLALFIGVVSVLGFAPFSFPPALIGAWAWLFYKLEREDSAKRAFWLSYAFGAGQFIAGLFWMGESTLVDFATWWWAWPLATFVLPLLFALYPAIAGFLTVRLKLARLPAAMLLFTLAEVARGTLFTGFPWNLAGSTWIEVPWIAQNADWAGLWGLTAITFLLSALLAQFKDPKALALGVAVLLVMTVYGVAVRQPTTYNEDVSVHIVQPNIPQKLKWANGHVFDNSLAPIAASDTPPQDSAKEHWIIWPETAQASPIWRQPRFRVFYRGALGDWPANTTVLTGYLGLDEGDYGNAVVAADIKGNILWRQNKHHLVPFGEYMPLDDILHLGPIVGMDGFPFGEPPRSMAGGIVPLICYEIIFSDLARRAVASDSRAIVTVTDDSWFGTTSGPHQHMTQVRFRAIETGLPILRSANTGISAIVDPYGRVVSSTELNTSGTIDGLLPAKRTALTFHNQHGQIFVYLYFGIGFLILLMGKRFQTND